MSESHSPPPERNDDRLLCNQEFASLDAFCAEYISNLSQSGVFVRSTRPMPVGTLLKLEFTIITEEGFETLRGIGEVMRVSTSPRGMGVVFTELEPESQALIERLFRHSRPNPKPEADAT